MRLLGAKVTQPHQELALSDAMNEALRFWVANAETHFYIIGTVAGPHPYPQMVRDFQSVIGKEAKEQLMEAEGRLPDAIIACIGGGSNAMGLFHPFLDDESVSIYGVEAAGKGILRPACCITYRRNTWRSAWQPPICCRMMTARSLMLMNFCRS